MLIIFVTLAKIDIFLKKTPVFLAIFIYILYFCANNLKTGYN